MKRNTFNHLNYREFIAFRNIVVILFYIFSVCMVSAQNQIDTIAADLQEITVDADMQHTSAISSTFYPTKYVKQAANDGYDLLRRMNIPAISINFNSTEVATNTGQPVTIFVNYIKTTPEEMAGLRAQDVKKIEYMDFPSDSRFQGAPHVLNIIMRGYEYGGYTKISDTYYALDTYENSFSVFSKFAYKSMIYDLYAGSSNYSDNNRGTSEKSIFSLGSGNVERIQDYKDNITKYMGIPVSFRALWRSDKISISNTIGFNFRNHMKNRETGTIRFIPGNLDDVNDYEYNTPMVSRSVSWNGNYYFSFPRQWGLSIMPGVLYTHFNSTNEYTMSNDGSPKEVIVNNSREDAWNYNLSANLQKVFGRHSINLMISGQHSDNAINYYGTSPSSVDFRKTMLSSKILYTLSYGNKFSLNADAGVCRELFDTNDKKYDDTYSFAHAYASYSPNLKNSMSVWFQYASNSPNIFMRSPNIIKQEEMLYQSGNPLIKNARHYTTELVYRFFPSNVFTMMVAAQYYWSDNTPVRVFSEYDNGNALLMSYMNKGDFRRFALVGNFNLRLINGRLNINVSPQYGIWETTGYASGSLNKLRCNVTAGYYLGNFNFTAAYGSPLQRIEEFSEARTKIPSSYQISAGWAKGNWNLSLSICNFFRYNYEGVRTEYKSPLYVNDSLSITNAYHAYGQLSATYTFGYGKKATDRSEIGAQGSAQSSRM